MPQRKYKSDEELKAKYRGVQRGGKVMGEHRFIMQQHLGRKLLRREHVHHINGNPLDNRLENLQLMGDSEHVRLHGVFQSVAYPIAESTVREWAEQILARRKTTQEIAGELGYSHSLVCRRIAALGITIPKGRRPSVDPAKLQAALNSYFSGAGLSQCAGVAGISKSHFHQYAQKDPRYKPQVGSNTPEIQQAVRSMYLAGTKLADISSELGIDRATVCRTVRKLGLPKRKPKPCQAMSITKFDNASVRSEEECERQWPELQAAIVSAGRSKPASGGHFKTGQSEVGDS